MDGLYGGRPTWNTLAYQGHVVCVDPVMLSAAKHRGNLSEVMNCVGPSPEKSGLRRTGIHNLVIYVEVILLIQNRLLGGIK